MPENEKPGLIDTVKSIADDAAELVEALKPKAETNANLSNRELATIRKLVKRAEDAMSEANERAKEQRRLQIDELERLIKKFDLALATPGLDESVRQDIKRLRRKRRSRLLHLKTKEAVDFGGILTAAQVEEIAEVLKRAKQDVARKKKAAAFIGTLMKVADIGLSIVAKVVVPG